MHMISWVSSVRRCESIIKAMLPFDLSVYLVKTYSSPHSWKATVLTLKMCTLRVGTEFDESSMHETNKTASIQLTQTETRYTNNWLCTHSHPLALTDGRTSMPLGTPVRPRPLSLSNPFRLSFHGSELGLHNLQAIQFLLWLKIY